MIIDFLIIDNTALVSKFNLNIFSQIRSNAQILITNDVYEEANANAKSLQVLEVAQMQGILKIQDPSEESLLRVDEYSFQTGDQGALSLTDKGLIALCLDLRIESPEKEIYLMSDDYSIQNVCAQIQPPIKIYNFTKEGIKESIIWEVYCPQCYKKYPPSKLNEKCDICNLKLKRKKKSVKK